MKNCVKKGNVPISESEARDYYYDFIEPKMLYHYPEDSDTLKFAIDAYNYFKN